MTKSSGSNGHRRHTPAVPTQRALPEADSKPTFAAMWTDEPTRALPLDGRGNPLLLAGLLRATREAAPEPVSHKETTVKVVGPAETDEARPLRTVPSKQADAPEVRGRHAQAPRLPLANARTADGVPDAEIPPLTSAELSSIFPPEMREPAAEATVKALDEAQAAAPSRLDGERDAFADFSSEIVATRGPTKIGAMLDEKETAPLAQAASAPPRRHRRSSKVTLLLAVAAASAAVTMALGAGLLR